MPPNDPGDEDGDVVAGEAMESSDVIGPRPPLPDAPEGLDRGRHELREFCSSTAMHGMRYLFQPDLNKYEKVFWVAALLLSLAGSAVLMHRMYGRWETTPVVGTNQLMMRAVWELPFPAVTICPQNKWDSRPAINASDAANATDGPDQRKDIDELGLQRVKSLLCENPPSCSNEKIVPESDIDFLVSVAPKWTDTSRGFKWRRKMYANLAEQREGSELWTPILTEEGLCFTLNILQSSELFTEAAVQHSLPLPDNETRFPARGWSASKGYEAEGGQAVAVDSTYPARAMPGADNGLGVLLCANVQDIDYNCSGPAQGFKVVLHHPAEMPHMRHHTRSVLGRELHMIVEHSATTFSDELPAYEPSERACYLPDERRLRYFRVYTRKNCELECFSNFSRGLCGCAPFYLPRSSDVPICGPGSSDCVRRAEEEMISEEIRAEGLRRAGLGCRCLPACASVEYDSHAQLADFAFKESMRAWRFPEVAEFIGADCARLVVHFPHRAGVVGRQRNEMYSSAKLIAACASILGLFTGFSVINVVEALFFASRGVVARVFRKCGARLPGSRPGRPGRPSGPSPSTAPWQPPAEIR